MRTSTSKRTGSGRSSDYDTIPSGRFSTGRRSRLSLTTFRHGLFDKGWTYTPPDYVPPFGKTLSDGDEMGPDELLQNDERLWPDTRAVPFHYPHPVTGEFVAEEDLRAPVLGTDAKAAKPARVINDSF
jgi:hypothetical protein